MAHNKEPRPALCEFGKWYSRLYELQRQAVKLREDTATGKVSLKESRVKRRELEAQIKELEKGLRP